MWESVGYFGLKALELAVITRAITRPHRQPTSRAAWVVVIAVLPLFGMLCYLLFGETSIGRKRIARAKQVLADLPDPATISHEPSARELEERAPHDAAGVQEARYAPLFELGETINGFRPVGGNRATLMADSNAGIDAMVADMDAATETIHLIFYIWLGDNNGLKVAEALKRAAARGVTCRAMADALGSRVMIRSKTWKEMRDAGVHVAEALPIGNPLLRPFHGRIDLRNHRKILVVDGAITYCGSQNCADPEFRVKPKYAPWVDTLMRFEGPIATQNQYVFIGDWMAYVDEDLSGMLQPPSAPHGPGFTAQVIATGPTVRDAAMPETFETLMYAARRELVITTPYYVPNEAMQAALCAAANRGVETTIVFPARNDSWECGGASRSYYLELLEAGVRIHEYVGGLLHAKTLTVDGKVTLIGSANMDRRSFDLNYENNILLVDEEVTAALRERQATFLASSNQVELADVEAWSLWTRLKNNTIGVLGPLL